MNTVQQRGILRASDETTWKGKYFIKRFLSAWQALPMAPQQCADVLTPTTTKLKIQPFSSEEMDSCDWISLSILSFFFSNWA